MISYHNLPNILQGRFLHDDMTLDRVRLPGKKFAMHLLPRERLPGKINLITCAIKIHPTPICQFSYQTQLFQIMSHTHAASVKNLDRNVEDAVQCNKFSCSFFLIFIINPLHFDIFRPSTNLLSCRQISTRWLYVCQMKKCIIWLYHIPFTYKYLSLIHI